MQRTTATEARKRLFKLLDAAEAGEEIIVERSGVRFRLTLDRSASARPPATSPLIVEDESLLENDWTWQTDKDGQLVFDSRRSTR